MEAQSLYQESRLNDKGVGGLVGSLNIFCTVE